MWLLSQGSECFISNRDRFHEALQERCALFHCLAAVRSVSCSARCGRLTADLLGRSFEEVQAFFRVVLPRTYSTDAQAEAVIKMAMSIKVPCAHGALTRRSTRKSCSSTSRTTTCRRPRRPTTTRTLRRCPACASSVSHVANVPRVCPCANVSRVPWIYVYPLLSSVKCILFISSCCPDCGEYIIAPHASRSAVHGAGRGSCTAV